MRHAPWLLILLITVVTFSRLAQCDFLRYDDQVTVAQNTDLNPPTFAKIAHYWREPLHGLYMPVTYMVWAALARVARGQVVNDTGSFLKPSVFHTANIFVHALSAVLVYRLLRLLMITAAKRREACATVTPSPGTAGEGRGGGQAHSASDQAPTPTLPRSTGGGQEPHDAQPATVPVWPAFCGALLFAIHPTQVEPVAWVSGLKDVMCGMLVLAALWQYVLHATASRDGGSKRWLVHAVLATLLFATALLVKPTSTMAPLMAIAIDRWLIGRAWRRVLVLPLVWLVLASPIVILTSRINNPDATTAPPKLWLRPFIAGDALTFYFRQLVAPAQFVVDHGRRPDLVLAWPITYVIWLVPACVAFIVWRRRRSQPWLVAAAIVFVAPLLPVLGLRPFMMQYISTVADHYLYLPLFGVAIAFAFVLAQTQHRGVRYACGGVFAAFVFSCVIHAGVWQDSMTFYQHSVALQPNGFIARLGLAHELERIGDFDGDTKQLAEAVRCHPNFPACRAKYAIMLATFDHLTEAAEQCRAMMPYARRWPKSKAENFAEVYTFVGRRLVRANKPALAVPLLEEALYMDPGRRDSIAALDAARSQLASVPRD